MKTIQQLLLFAVGAIIASYGLIGLGMPEEVLREAVCFSIKILAVAGGIFVMWVSVMMLLES